MVHPKRVVSYDKDICLELNLNLSGRKNKKKKLEVLLRRNVQNVVMNTLKRYLKRHDGLKYQLQLRLSLQKISYDHVKNKTKIVHEPYFVSDAMTVLR